MDQLPAAPEPGEQTADAEPAKPQKRGGGFLRGVLEIIETLVLTFVIFFVIQNFVAQPFEVHQWSMQHTFEPKDYVLVDKLTIRFTPYERGDVVVFTPPDGWGPDKTPFIKRVIGVPGDEVEIRDGAAWVNGTKLDEPYLFAADDGVIEPTEALTDKTAWKVQPGELFVMGDHRMQSQDSRAFGPIPQDSVIGRGFVRYWPIAKFSLVQRPTYPAP